MPAIRDKIKNRLSAHPSEDVRKVADLIDVYLSKATTEEEELALIEQLLPQLEAKVKVNKTDGT